MYGGGWLAALGTNFGLGHGYADFAGSGLVHAVGGLSDLALAMVIGHRIGALDRSGRPNAIPGSDPARRQMKRFGGLLTIAVEGGGQAATQVADALKLFALAPSPGGVESLVTQPCTTTHHGLTPEERRRRGISDAMLRLSVGLEEADDLIADLHQALG